MKDIDALRAKLVGSYPLFTKKICELDWIEDNTQPTCCTDGHYLKYNIDFLSSRTTKDALFILLHEVVHVWCGHPVRFAGPQWKDDIRQQACDYAANAMLIAMDMDKPNDALYEYKWRNNSAEEIYSFLDKPNPPQPRGSKGRGRFEDDPDANPKDKQQMKKLEQKIVREQLQDMATARICGGMNADLERMLTKLTEPVQDWKEILAEYLVTNQAKEDYTFTSPNRRYNDGMIMPSLFGETPPLMVLGGDTSGSITKKQSATMASEVMGLIESVEPEELYVIWADRKVQRVQVMDEFGGEELQPKGGGGTDFRPVFEYVEENNLAPELLLYMTDGYCHLFPPPPPYDVVWLVWQDKHPFNPPFGEVIVMQGMKL